MTTKKDKMLVVRMTEEERIKLKAYADKEERSMAAVIRLLLKGLVHTN